MYSHADVWLSANGFVLTYCKDVDTQVARDFIRVPVFLLLVWFFEMLETFDAAEPEDKVSFCMSEIGRGYVWPAIQFTLQKNKVQITHVAEPVSDVARIYFPLSIDTSVYLEDLRANVAYQASRLKNEFAKYGVQGVPLDFP